MNSINTYITCHGRPKNLRDLLVRAKVALRTQDRLFNPLTKIDILIDLQIPSFKTKTSQKLMTDFFKIGNTPKTPVTSIPKQITYPQTKLGKSPNFIAKKDRGHIFCNFNTN